MKRVWTAAWVLCWSSVACKNSGKSNASSPAQSTLAIADDRYPITASADASNASAEAAQFAADSALLATYVQAHPEATDFITGDATGAVPTADGNYIATVTATDGSTFSVETMGKHWRYSTLASRLRSATDRDTQARIYSALVHRVPAACSAPAMNDALSIDQIVAANHQMAACFNLAAPKLGAKPALALQPVVSPADEEGAAAPAIVHDWGGDGASPPTIANHSIYTYFSWPGRTYDSSIKRQGNRATCVAFAYAAALENVIAQQYGRHVNLSEQALYAKGKLSIEPSNQIDGLSSPVFGPGLVASGYRIPHEGIWIYNPSPGRVGCGGAVSCPSGSYFQGSCADNKGNGYKDGACSDTTHQAAVDCANGKCAYVPQDKDASGYVASQITEIGRATDIGQSDIELAKTFAASGVPLIYALQMSPGLSTVNAQGFMGYDPGTNTGGHDVEISGVIWNVQLPPGLPNGEGGGYFIVKNSWGASYGDGGYSYLSFDYVARRAYSFNALLDSTPGTSSPPTISISAPQTGTQITLTGGLEPATPLAANVADAEDGSACCNVTWSSDLDGLMATGAKAQFYFLSAGTRTVTATATDSDGNQTSAQIQVTVLAAPAAVQITKPVNNATLYVGQSYLLEGQARAGQTFLPCTSLKWSSNMANDPLPATGCNVPVIFSTPGPRTIVLGATTDTGAVSVASEAVTVIELPPQSPPVISILYPTNGTVLDPYASATFTATVSSPSGPLTSAQWRAQTSFTDDDPAVTIGDTVTIAWTPSNSYSKNCGPENTTIYFYAADAYGLSVDSAQVILNWPICLQ